MEDFDKDFMETSTGKIFQIPDRQLGILIGGFSDSFQENQEQDPIFMLSNLIKGGQNIPGDLFDAAVVAISEKVKYELNPETRQLEEVGADNETVNMLIQKLYSNRVEVGNIGKMAKKENNPFAICHSTVSKDKDPEKWERCVLKLKEQNKKAFNLKNRKLKK